MAAHLAIVANQREAASLTGETEPDDMGRSLLRVNRADVAVIKMGAHGARVISHGSAESIPAHRTKSIFPIGSGDVFSAVFAFHWAEKGRGAVEAATVASAATAQYCSNPHAFLNRLPVGSLGAPIQPTGGGRQPRRVYLAGPFFTAAQRWLVYEARTALASQGVEVFSPLHDVGEGPASEVAVKDLAGLKTSDAVLAIVDEFDAGTLFEVGYARSRDIPVVALVQNAPPGPLKMIEGSGCEIVDDFVSSIYRTVWAALER